MLVSLPLHPTSQSTGPGPMHNDGRVRVHAASGKSKLEELRLR